MSDRKSPQREPPLMWSRQDGESPQAFQAFAEYRDMGAERSLAKVAQKLGKSKALMDRWSRHWHWGERVNVWDDEMDKLSCVELKKGITEMRKNHIGIAKAMLVKELQALQKLPITEMTPKDITTMVDVAAKLERISRGEATEKTESKTELAGELKVNSVDLSSLSDAELEMLNELVNKVDPN